MSEFKKTVYKKDTKGKIRFLTVSSEEGKLIQESGIVGGKATKRSSLCKAKNVGRSNETTPEEQAKLEANSKIDTKMSTGYFDTIEEAENEEVILPMLAKSYDKEKNKVVFPCFIQPKLDGMRCLIQVKSGKVTMWSRKGKEITTLPHIIEAVENSNLYNIVLDGELYIHGETFQKNISLIKKYRPGESEKIEFRIYDVVSPEPYTNRMVQVARILDKQIPHISEVETLTCIDEKAIKLWHGYYVEQGYEGSMIRWGDGGYKINGRSSNLLKNKDFLDIDAVIVDIEPSDRNPEQGVAICEIEAGKFGCGMKLSHAEREEILTNKKDYIGKLANIRFFEYSDSGVPRFPVFIGVHEDR